MYGSVKGRSLTPERSFDVQVSVIGSRPFLIRGRDAYELSDVAKFIWQCCDGVETVDGIIARLIAEYCVSTEVAQKDVGMFLDELQGEGLLVSPNA